MLDTHAHDLRAPLDALKSRMRSEPSSLDAEGLWPLALQIDSAVSRVAPCSAQCQEASRCLLWAVSAAIRAQKLSGRADLDGVCAALTSLEGRIAS
ncbi:hypothetical protein ASG48_03345 [Aurantimonas sp. Leaf443]|nr:hypothetical protein ASG48_03345 [Aurantimonas sp. Leaf443]